MRLWHFYCDQSPTLPPPSHTCSDYLTICIHQTYQYDCLSFVLLNDYTRIALWWSCISYAVYFVWNSVLYWSECTKCLIIIGLHLSLLVCVLVTQWCLTLCDPMDCSPPGSSVHGILQARVLEWVAISFSRGSSRPRDWTLGGSDGKESACNVEEIWVWSLGWEDALEKEMATHCSTFVWKIPWTEEPASLQSMESQRVRHHWVTSLSLLIAN